MRTKLIGAATVGAILATFAPAPANIGTHSFTNHDGGAHPHTLSLGGSTITVDLSAIAGAEVYRATLDPGMRFEYVDVSWNSLASSTMRISSSGEDLAILPPRYDEFDATDAVRAALAGGGTLALSVDDAGSGLGPRISLDVLCDAALSAAIDPATDVAARFEKGDAMITFTEPDPPLPGDTAPCTDFYDALQSVDDVHKVRYRIYRSGEPIATETALAAAELVDEIRPLSGWNPRYLGPGGQCYSSYGSGTVRTLPVADSVRAAGSTGIYVDRFRGDAPDTVYYFVSRAVDGAEDFALLGGAGGASGPVPRAPGTGMVLLDKIEYAPEFNYGYSAGQRYYVKWEAPPASNFPSSAYNYVVALPSPEFAVPAPGVDLALHCWGGNLNTCYGWWYAFEQGHLLVAGNQFPFEDWWTGYHENLGTLKAWDDGTVKPFTMYRLLAFVYDFVAPEFGADLDRVILSGSSMGGSGTSLVGLRNGQVFSNLISWVGVHIPRETPVFTGSFEKAWGREEWNASFSNEEFAARFGGEVVTPADGYGVWDYYDNDQWLRANPGVPTPWMTYSNGADDTGIGWEQAVANTDALVDTWRPFNFQWGMNGHSQRVALLDPYGYDKTQKSRLVFARNESHPAFRNGSADADYHADSSGKVNAFVSWEPESGVDESGRWEMSIFVPDAPSGGSYGVVFPESLTTDVFPVHAQRFAPTPGFVYDWTWSVASTGALLAQGTAVADSLGRVLAPGLVLKKNEPRRLVFTAADVSVGSGAPPKGAFRIEANRPNPFNPRTEIVYALGAPATVRLALFDVAGRRVRRLDDGPRPAGTHSVSWDGRSDDGSLLPSGVYFVRLAAGEAETTRKILLVR